MRTTVRWTLVVVMALHALVHLLGTVKGFGWAEVSQLQEPITPSMAVVWLADTVFILVAAVMTALRTHGWWLVTGGAALLSQVAVVTSWSDANAGTVANVLMLLAAGYGFAGDGPRSFRAQYRDQVSRALTPLEVPVLVTHEDARRLPYPVAEYVRRSGAVGEPRVKAFRARIHGRIRAGSDKPWMVFTGEQVNTFGRNPRRLFFMDATMKGLPVDVFHSFTDHAATMRARLCSVVPIVSSAGAEITRAETVTLFNDLCVLAPGALADADITWEQLDARRVRGTITIGSETVSADLVFGADGDLVDFVSEDRLRAAPDGKSFTRMPWSTPLIHYATLRGRRLAVRGEAVWHAPAPEGRLSYLEFAVDDIVYNPVVTSRLSDKDQQSSR